MKLYQNTQLASSLISQRHLIDTIDHTILIKKLERYGIRGVAKEWFENYLYNRKKIVKYNEVQSEEMIIRSGVPQGSVLGPAWFLLYIIDIQYCSGLVSIVRIICGRHKHTL